MPEEIVMPRLSDTMQQGTIVRWLKREGDTVAKDDVLAEVETDKAIMELQSYVSGVLERILVPEGSTAPIGSPIAIVRLPGETPMEAPRMEAPQTPQVESAEDTAKLQISSAEAQVGRIKASPLARRIAEEMGVDLSRVRGTGEGGRIIKEDVLAFVEQHRGQVPAPSPLREAPAASLTEPTERPLGHIQKVIARRMVESKTTVPHFYVTVEVDMGNALRLRDEINSTLRTEGIEVTLNDMVVKAVALALRAMPEVNASFAGDKLLVHQRVNVGIAVGTDELLLVPVIKDCDRKPLKEIAAEARRLVEKARAGRLALEDVEGGTFTVSNLGMYGVDEFSAIVNPPQAAILAVGAVQEKPVVQHGQIVMAQRMRITLSADHRVFYGVTGAKFLSKVRELLEKPLLLLV
jgi:pyruvate dehydrogenase E2 component (dihydrolipoamide acetyltransferase)